MTKFDDPITTEPSQIASALLAQGLPLAIAQQIAASSLPANTAGQILATGVKTVDVPVILDAGTNRTIANGNNVIWSPGATDQLQSMIVEIGFTTNVTPAIGKTLDVRIAWSNGEPAGFSGLSHEFALHCTDSRGQSAIRVPVLGTSCNITYTNNTGVSVTINTYVLGSQRVCNKPAVEQVVGAGAPWANVGGAITAYRQLSTGQTPITLVVGNLAPLPPLGREITVTLSPNATTTAVGRFCLLDAQGVRIGDNATMTANSAAAATLTWSTKVGWAPVFIRCDVIPTGAASVFATVAWNED